MGTKNRGVPIHISEALSSLPFYNAVQQIGCIPTPILENCNKAQLELIKESDYKWWAIAHWAAALRIGNINFRAYPYNSFPFNRYKIFGKLYAAQLGLTIGVFERFQPPEINTPLKWWVAQLQEQQDAEIYGIIAADRLELSGFKKRESIERKRQELKILSSKGLKVVNANNEAKVADLLSSYLPKKKLLMEKAVKFPDRTDERGRQFYNQYWLPYISTYREYIESLHENDYCLSWNRDGAIFVTSKSGNRPQKILPKS